MIMPAPLGCLLWRGFWSGLAAGDPPSPIGTERDGNHATSALTRASDGCAFACFRSIAETFAR